MSGVSEPRSLGNPVLRRELLGMLRDRRGFALIAGLALALGALVLLRWPGDGQLDLQGERSREVLRLLGCGLTAGVLLLAPAFPATSVVSERKRGTLALLFNSPMRPWQIYCGKLGAVLAYVGLLLVATLPASAACFAMGGVSLRQDLLPLYGVLALAATQGAAAALWVSCRAGSTDGALRISYALVFGLCVVTLGPHYFFQGKPGLLPALASRVHDVSPLPAVERILGLGAFGPHGLERGGVDWRRHVLASLTATAALVVGGLFSLRPAMLDRSRSSGVMTQDRGLAARILRRLVFLVDPQSRKGGVPRLLNPVLVKEYRTRRFGRSHWLLRLVALCAVGSLFLTYTASAGIIERGPGVVGGLLVMLQITLVVLITPSLSAGLISAEREHGGWTLLQMTPLSPVRIVWGKLLSVLTTLVLILSATLPGYLVMLFIQPSLRPQVVRVVISLAWAAVVCLLAGAAVGSWFRRAAAATAAAYSLLLALFGGTLLVWLGRGAPFGHGVVRGALLLNPGATALASIEAADFAQYQLLPNGWWASGALAALFLFLLLVQTWRLTRPE